MTAPFPFHPATGPQAPFLRPDPLHEEPGALGSLTPILLKVAQQVQEQQQHQQEMLIQRGHLAVQEETAKFQRDKFNEEKKRRDLAKQALDSQLGVPGVMHPAAEAANKAMGVDPAASQDGAGAQPPQGGGQPDIGAMASSPDAGMQQIAEHLMAAKHQQDIATRFQGVLGNYTGEQLRNDPNARAEATGKMYGIDPVTTGAWEKNNPPRKLDIKSSNGVIAAFDSETGDLVKVINTPGKLSAIQDRLNQYAPQYSFGISGMKAIEQRDPASAQAAAAAIIGSGNIRMLGTRPQDFFEAMSKQGFTGNTAKYAQYLKNAVEASLGMQIGGRGGQAIISLVQDVLLPGPNEITNPDAMQARWQGRETRIANWKNAAMHTLFDEPAAGTATPGAPDPSDDAITQLNKLYDKITKGGK